LVRLDENGILKFENPDMQQPDFLPAPSSIMAMNRANRKLGENCACAK